MTILLPRFGCNDFVVTVLSFSVHGEHRFQRGLQRHPTVAWPWQHFGRDFPTKHAHDLGPERKPVGNEADQLFGVWNMNTFCGVEDMEDDMYGYLLEGGKGCEETEVLERITFVQ